MSYHDAEAIGSIHVAYNWEYADAAARNGATGLVVGDNGKFARQLNDNSLWMLIDYSGPTWISVAGSQVVLSGSGNPNGVVTGYLGQLYYDETNDMFYRCNAGSTTSWLVA